MTPSQTTPYICSYHGNPLSPSIAQLRDSTLRSTGLNIINLQNHVIPNPYLVSILSQNNSTSLDDTLKKPINSGKMLAQIPFLNI